MAHAPVVANTIVRCPVCLISQSVAENFPANKRLYCGNCGRDFVFKNALPVSGSGLSSAAATTAKAVPAGSVPLPAMPSRNPVLIWVLGLIVLLLALKNARPFMAGIKGPEFLMFYFFVFIVVYIGVQVLRNLWEDNLHVSLISLIIFETIGVLRYIDGSAAGMHKFDFMFFMMGLGALLIFTRWEHDSGYTSSSDSCSSDSGGGGCGGGGGGCGGCGG